MTTVLVLVGSLRAGSLNRRIADLATTLAPEGTEVRVAEGLAEVPFYNEDLDGEQPPAAAAHLREQVDQAEALLLVTPEYNGGLPAVLKNAIDWASRPYGRGALRGKPVAALGAAVGQYGGVWAHQDSLKAARIAGGDAHEEPAASFVSSGWTTGPENDPQVADAVRRTLATLVRQVHDQHAA